MTCRWECENKKCYYFMPDSMRDCCGYKNCKGYEMVGKILDDRFGMVGTKDWTSNPLLEDKKVIDGVGADAEIITNSAGGKQSKSPMAMHLVDPKYLKEIFEKKADSLEYLDEGGSTCVDDEDIFQHSYYRAIVDIADYMQTGVVFNLELAMGSLECDELQQTIRIAKVLQYGADRYGPNNWRLIPEEEHINHALIHVVAAAAGDTQDDHIDHALCRLMMAYATEKSPNFEYNKYIPQQVN